MMLWWQKKHDAMMIWSYDAKKKDLMLWWYDAMMLWCYDAMMLKRTWCYDALLTTNWLISLTFLDKVQHPMCVMVMYHIPLVTCQMLLVTCHQFFQPFRASELTFWSNVHHPMSVMCPMSHFICHVSCVTRHKKKLENLRGLSVEGLLSKRA